MKVADRVDGLTVATSGILTPISLGADVNGAAFGMDYMNGCSMTASVTGGSAAGTLKLQACNNPFLDNVNLNEDPNALWVDIPGSAYTVAGPEGFMWNITDINYRAIRWAFVRSAGTGSMVVWIHAKGTAN